ncbi:MAG: hypothetical protein K6A40_02195 [Solobacterium sp.]|nr:hypothetical protein [Solobacterium sp.]
MKQGLMVFGVPLIMTLLIEMSGAYTLGVRRRDDLTLVAAVNLLTNPPAVFLAMMISNVLQGSPRHLVVYGVLEPLIVFIEYLYYDRDMETSMHPLFLSVILNILSVTGGIICAKLFWQTL